jgi:hypothetical protein
MELAKLKLLHCASLESDVEAGGEQEEMDSPCPTGIQKPPVQN